MISITMKKDMNKHNHSIRMTDDAWQTLAEMAAADHRTVNNYVQSILMSRVTDEWQRRIDAANTTEIITTEQRLDQFLK